ncbi:aminotransferase, partial [Francisella tularensis subsp. holarctica]|nr:aminotransferase [Francisella tularensis subsp. holarctica]
MLQANSYIDTPPSVSGKFALMANEYKALHFTQGAPDFDTPEWLFDRTNFYFQHGKYLSSPIPGAVALRNALVQKT